MTSSIYLVGKPGKKSFMYFSSSLGKGFIISDDEEVTGVISVKSKVEIRVLSTVSPGKT